MWADTRRLPNLIGEEWGRKGITLSVRQYSVAALKDDRYSKSYIICWKCLHLRTLAERRSRSSCWPQPRSYITVFGTCLATFSSIKCNEIPQGFTNSVFHYRRRRGCGQTSWNFVWGIQKCSGRQDKGWNDSYNMLTYEGPIVATSGSLEGRRRNRAHWEHLCLLDVPTSHLANPQIFGPPQLYWVPKRSKLWVGLVTYLEDNSDFCKIKISHMDEATKPIGPFRSSVDVAKSQRSSMDSWAEVLGRKHKGNGKVWCSVRVVVAACSDSFYGASVQKWECIFKDQESQNSLGPLGGISVIDCCRLARSKTVKELSLTIP